MSHIHITNGQSDKILATIPKGHILFDEHEKSLKDSLETFNFITFADKKYSAHLGKKNRAIIPEEDGTFREFVILGSGKHRGSDGVLKAEVYTSASYLLLRKAKVIRPQSLAAQTSETAVAFSLSDTEWQPGIITFNGIRTFQIESYTDPFSFLKIIAREFELELRFRIVVEHNQVIGRYVDMLPRVGVWNGREAEFGKDLLTISRKENTDNLVTALVGVGPEREDGTRIEVFVEDKEALERWGKNGQHFIEHYEPETSDMYMTEERLTTLTQMELNKRVHAVVEYQADIADLEHIPGMENKKIRFGDTIKIKDLKFEPPLYLEARVHNLKRSIVDKSKKRVELGDFIEYTEEEVNAMWKLLREQIKQKVSLLDVLEATYSKESIDSKDESVYADGTHYSDVVSNTAKVEAIDTAAEDATEKANQAEVNAKGHAEQKALEAENNAKSYALSEAEKAKLEAIQDVEADLTVKADKLYVDAELSLKVAQNTYDAKVLELQGNIDNKIAAVTFNTTVTNINNDIADKADLTYVDGQLVDKANVADTYTKTEVNNALDSKVSTTTYTTDQEGIVTRLDSAETSISSNESEIALKASQTDLDTVEGRLSSAETSITANANEIALKATQTDVDEVEGRVSTAEGTLSVHATQIASKVSQADHDSLTGRVGTAETNITQNASEIATKASKSDMDALGTRMSSAETSITQNANQIALKASQEELDTVEGRMTSAEATLSVQSNQISTKVSSTDFSNYKEETGSSNDFRIAEKVITTSGWYRVASNVGNRAFATFTVRETYSGKHLTAIFNAGITYGKNPKLTLTGFSNYGSQGITKARLVYAGTYDKPYLEIYVVATANVSVWVSNNVQVSGWITENLTAGSIPNGYTSVEFDINASKLVDVTADNTSKDTASVNGVPSSTVINRIGSAESSITQNANQIALKVSQTDYDLKVTEIESDVGGLTTRMSNAESSITQNANDISIRVTETTFNSAMNTKEGTVYKQNTAPSHANGKLWLDTSKTPNILYRSTGSAWVKVTPTTAAEVGAYSSAAGSSLESRVTSAEASITTNANAIELRVTQSEYDGTIGDIEGTLGNYGSRISTAESTITQHANEISLRVTTTTYNSGMSGKENTVYKQTSAPAHSNGRLWLNTSVTPNILYRSTGSAWVKATPTTAGEVGAYTSAAGVALESRITTAESEIMQNANEISLKVSKDGVISSINQTSEMIKIQASNIEIDGDLTVTNGLVRIKSGIITNAMIDNVSASKLTSGTIDADSITIANNKVSINAGGVAVKDGDFFVEDGATSSRSVMKIKHNLISDHSFEAIAPDYNAPVSSPEGFQGTADTLGTSSLFRAWYRTGVPVIATIWETDNDPSEFIGYNAVYVNDTNYVNQLVPIKVGNNYTFSLHCRRAIDGSTGTPRIIVYHYNSADQLLGTSTGTLKAPLGSKWERNSFTFTPNANTHYSRITIRSTTSTWVLVDGVQLVEGAISTIYESESDLYKFMNGQQIGNKITTRDIEVIRGGIVLPFANSSATGYQLPAQNSLTYVDNSLTLYGNRALGDAFRIRSHSNSGGYRDDFSINGNGDTVVNGNLLVSGRTPESYMYRYNSDGSFHSLNKGGVHTSPSLSSGLYIAYHNGSSWYKLRAGQADSVVSSSKEELKESILELPFSSLEMIASSKVYKWRYKEGNDYGYDGYRYGMIIGRATPNEVLSKDGEGVDHLSMISIAWDSIRELNDKMALITPLVKSVQELRTQVEDDINDLRIENQLLKARVKQLETKVA
ncbi:phage tail spike protein [Sutcliffiella horikoshii]|uniref:phage tail spike protein n=1 Tax=Sutcliffiella horikoshii TaxID=79883 RepID=UPI003CEAD824